MWKPALAAVLLLPGLYAAPVRSGHATAEWITASNTAEGGTTLRTAIELIIDPHWHTYWINPGEAGMTTSVEWKMPTGWKVKSFSHPAPVQFKTGELVGFGHEGTARFPVEIEVAKDFSGIATLEGTVSWLSCNDEACVPGDALVKLTVTSGKPSNEKRRSAVDKAFASVPKLVSREVSLSVTAGKNHWIATMEGNPGFDPSTATTFVETADTVDPKSKIQWAKSETGWIAKLPKSSYAPDRLKQFALVLVPSPPAVPIRVHWQK